MNDQDIYQKIGQLLVDVSPSDAIEIIVRGHIFSVGDGGRYEFDYINQSGELNWFAPAGRAVGGLTELLVQLRYFFLKKNMTAGERPWFGCEIKLNVGEMKLGIDFKYEN